ncbi:MAG: hypothetical protein IID46_01875 [Planctomycetes bacterium]|nr:hypothetical protein [Planctomycetota bacterium]
MARFANHSWIGLLTAGKSQIFKQFRKKTEQTRDLTTVINRNPLFRELTTGSILHQWKKILKWSFRHRAVQGSKSEKVEKRKSTIENASDFPALDS